MDNPNKSCSRVNIHSKLTVVSSSPTGPGKIHPLNALDHAMASHTVHIIFYYRVNPFVEGRFQFELDNLRVSLCELLCQYPTMTGRLGKQVGNNNWVVNCNDAGVRMLRASVGATIEEWLRTANANEEKDLAVWENIPAGGDDDDPAIGIWSPFQIQLNTFEGGGLAIGLSFSHMHADPTSAVLFLKSWTHLIQGKPIAQDPNFFLPSSINSATPKQNPYYSTKSKADSPAAKMGTATFRFSHSTLEKRLSKVLDKCPNATPFDFLAALFWTRIVRFKSKLPANDNTNTNTNTNTHYYSISISADARNLVQTPGYFGNALNFSLLLVENELLEMTKLEDVVVKVNRHVSGIQKENFWSNMDWLESRKDEIGNYSPPFQMYGPELTCVSMEHMMIGNDESSSSLMYATEFENGEKPVHVSCRVGNVQGQGLIVVMPSPEKGLARTVTVTLLEDEMGKLCEDQTIMELKPTMITSGRS